MPPATLSAGYSRRVGNARAGFEDDPRRGFASPRDFLLAVAAEPDPRRASDPRLRFLATAGSDEHSTFSDPHGGYLVPEAFGPGLLSVGVDADPTAGRTRAVPMEAPTLGIPARVDKDHTTSVSGGLTVSRKAESAEATASRMELEKITLAAHALFGLAYATEELLERSPMAFAAMLQAGFEEEFSSRILEEKLRGSGVGEYAGVLDSPCLITVPLEDAQEGGIVYENVLNMRARCWGYGRAIWLANNDALPQLMLLVQTVGTGGVPVWQPSAREGEPDTLLGRPIFFHEHLPSLGDVGDLLLGNWGEYLEGTYQPVRSAESVHVRFVEHERVYKFWMMNDGRPWWRSVLTPKNSSATLSPFVALAARS